jgi:hypothetical protein
MQIIRHKTNEPFEITVNWDVQSKKLKEKFPALTDSDLKFETGKEDELLSRLETRLGKNREELIGFITKAQPEEAQRRPMRSI